MTNSVGCLAGNRPVREWAPIARRSTGRFPAGIIGGLHVFFWGLSWLPRNQHDQCSTNRWL